MAYHSVLLERRQELHERTTQAIEKMYRHGVEDCYSELAHHYGRSGNVGKAVEYSGLAGRQALERSSYAEAITLAQEVSHPYSLSFALICAPLLHSYRREAQAAQERAAAGIALADEQGFSFFLGFGTISHGWALAEQGEVEDGIAQMRQGLDAWRATGAMLAQTWFLALLAEALGKAGRIEEGLNVLAEALATAQKTGERFYEAELHRLQGDLLLQSTAQDPEFMGERFSEAEACFHQALDIARRQSAKSLKLRAVMSLSRLMQGQGKREEVRQRLAEVYGWFTEGFDTVYRLEGGKGAAGRDVMKTVNPSCALVAIRKVRGSRMAIGNEGAVSDFSDGLLRAPGCMKVAGGIFGIKG